MAVYHHKLDIISCRKQKPVTFFKVTVTLGGSCIQNMTISFVSVGHFTCTIICDVVIG